MQRRTVLRGVLGLAGLTSLAGCALFAADESGPEDGRPPAGPTDSRPSNRRRVSADSTPYRDSDPAGNVYRARAVRIENRTRRERYVTVAVDEGDRMVALRNATVPPERTVTHYELVAKRGVYTVTIDTDSGATAVREFVVSEGVSDLDVVVGRGGIRTRQQARCWPDCPPVSTGGFVADFPRPETTVRWRGFGQVLVDNVDTQPREIRIRLWSNREAVGGERLLDYRYRAPAGMRLVLPLVAEGGRYEVAVSVAGRTARRVWHVPEESVAEFEVGDRVAGVCTTISSRSTRAYGPFRFGRIVNYDDVEHRLFVSIHHRGSVALDDHYVVGAGETVDVGFETPTLDDIELVARTEEGEDLVATWTHCPPAGELVLVVDERGRLQTYSDRQGLVGASQASGDSTE